MRKLLLLLVLNLSIAAMALNTLSQGFNRQSLSIEVAEVGGKQESFIRYEDADYFGSIGEPSVPVKTLRVSVPYNAVNIRLTYSLTKDCDIRLTSPVHYNINDLGGETEYFKGVKFPLENAAIDNIGYVDGINKIVTVYLCPVSLDLDNNLLTFYSSVSANLTWDIDDDLINEPIKPVVSYVSDKQERVYLLQNLVNPDEVEKNKVLSSKGTRIINLRDRADYIIVCPKEFAKDLERLAAYRRIKGYISKVFAIEDILTDPKYADGDVISGINDDAGKLRAFLTDAYKNRGTRYVLLAGKYPTIPIRYGHTTDTNISQYNRIPSDLYFSELNSSWNTSNSGCYGMKKDNLDYHSEIYVGRIPFTSISEINDFINKLKIYELNPGLGDSDYLSRAFVTCQMKGLIGSETYLSKWLSYMRTIYPGNNLKEIISNDNYPLGQDIINELNSTNYGCLSFVGHGNPYGVDVNRIGSDAYSILGLENQHGFSKYESKNGLNNLTNKNYPSWSYNMSCSTMPFDTFYINNYEFKVTKNFGESYVLGKDYGGVMYFGHTRPIYIYCTQLLHTIVFSILKTMYEDYLGEDGPEFSVTAGEVMSRLRTTNGIVHEARLSHNLLGDPLTPVWISKPNKVTYNEIDSAEYHFSLETNNVHHQNRSSWQSLKENLHPVLSFGGGYHPEIHMGTNAVYTVEYPNSLPVILPLYVQNFMFNKNLYIVAGNTKCGSYVNKEAERGVVEIMDSVSITIESLDDVYIKGMILNKNSELNIKADGNVFISDLYLDKNTNLVVEANSITSESINKDVSSTIKFTERNPQNRVAARSISEVYKPMLVEGRTWWYTSKHRGFGNPGHSWIAENGISVGDEIEINGMKWHKINVVSCVSRSDIWEYNTKPRTIAYMREDGNKIYTAYFEGVDNSYVEGVSEFMQEFTYDGCMPQLSYEYLNIGESYTVGDENYGHVVITVNNIYQIANSGFEYTLYESDVQYGSDVSFIEGLGCIANHYFFDPACGGTPSSTSYDYPQLRYITEADGTIIYEGIGGYRLWESTGIDNVIAEGKGSCRWYNLHGMEIEEPTSPGIYIRSSRNGNEKVAIR